MTKRSFLDEHDRAWLSHKRDVLLLVVLVPLAVGMVFAYPIVAIILAAWVGKLLFAYGQDRMIQRRIARYEAMQEINRPEGHE